MYKFYLIYKGSTTYNNPTRFNIQQFYMVLALLCVLYGSQNILLLLYYTELIDWFCITEVESVYCAVRTEFLYKTRFASKG
jgi:hypothetical protein